MADEWENLGVDPLFPGSGEVYRTKEGFMLNDMHGGKFSWDWIEENFEAREDDLFVVSFPKTGTTWAQEMAYVIGNDLDYERAKTMPLVERFPYLELKITVENGWVSNLTSPRFLKTHYPYSSLPQSIIDKKCKMIYTIRNPKDTLVSLYHFSLFNKLLDFQGDFEQFFNLFLEDKVLCAPFAKHILEFWERRDEDNILILHFEDMKKDSRNAIRQVAEFLGKTLTDEEVEKVAEHCSFDKMKKNPSTNYKTQLGEESQFMRKGVVGDWKNHFTDEMDEKMDEYIEKNFAGTGLNFSCD